ncbi:MAG TPA: hypothetical protein DDZ51_18180 [Planctomycetaceae bacterium]|nr:hypothetical protein [Planctomycetaceae bacterium]
MKANALPLRDVLFSELQFIVPFFQRSYSWSRDNWERIVDDIISVTNDGSVKKHFLGPLVCASLNAGPGVLPQYQLIDGQQRLTTLSILLAAVRDEAKKVGNKQLGAQIEVQYLVNQFRDGLANLKLVPRSGDRELYTLLIRGELPSPAPETRIVQAYEYFSKFVRTESHNDPLFLNRIFETVVNHLFLVSITLDEEDPYEIFESLNSTGLPLEESDLIRNYIFMQIPFEAQADFQSDQWQKFENQFEPADGYPALSPTAFYRDYLMRDGKYSKASSTFADFQSHMKVRGLKPNEMVKELTLFVGFAKAISRQGASSSPVIASAMHQLALVDAATANPAVLKLFSKLHENVINESEFIKCINSIVSFVLRRSICGESTRAYGKWFCELAGTIGDKPLEQVQSYLLHRQWPDDDAFAEGLHTFPIYHRELKKCRLLLETLEKSYGHKETVVLDSAIQIEHVMPQTLPSGPAGKAWRDMLGADFKKVHERLLHTLGNLTLTAYNPKLSNRSFDEKREELAKSNLCLNADIAILTVWDQQTIAGRAGKLIATIVKEFPRPDSGVAYVPPRKSGGSVNVLRERQAKYWQRLTDRLEACGLPLRPSRFTDGTSCNLFIDMADVSLNVNYVAAKSVLQVRLQFSRSRGIQIFETLASERSIIELECKTSLIWEPGERPSVVATLNDVSLKDELDWHDQQEWLVDVLSQFHVNIMDRLRSVHDATHEVPEQNHQLLMFWRGYQARLYEAKSSLLASAPLPQRWNTVAIGKSGVWIENFAPTKDTVIVVSLVLGTDVARDFFPKLLAQKDEIEAEMGQPLVWQNPENKKHWKVKLARENFDFANVDQWHDSQEWLVATGEQFNKVFRGRIQSLTS